MLVDIETGLLLTLRKVEMIENQNGNYTSDVTYMLKRMSYGKPVDASLFKLPSNDMREVQELSLWNAAKIKKELAGEPAPELALMDIRRDPVTPSSSKGQTV